MRTKDIKLKVYLEGVPVDISTINISEAIGQAPVARISMPPSQLFSKLYPKTLMHVFYKMEFPWRTAEESFNTGYYLIYEGELSGTSFSKSTNGNKVDLTFTGLTENWRRTYKTIVDLSLDTFNIGRFLLVGAHGIGTETFGAVEKEKDTTKKAKKTNSQENEGEGTKRPVWLMGKVPGTTITARLQQTAKRFINDSKVKNPLELTVKSLITDLADANPYYAKIHKVLKINDRVEVLENKQMLATLKGLVIGEVYSKSIHQIPPLTEGNQIINTITAKMDYVQTQTAAPTKSANGKPLSIFFTPDSFTFMPLRCNTFFPNDIVSFDYAHNFEAEPTRMISSTTPLGITNSGNKSSYAFQAKFVAPHTKFYQIQKDAEILGSKKIKTEFDKQSEEQINYSHEGMPAMYMTKEEMMRGTQPVITSFNAIEQSYISFHREQNVEKDEAKNDSTVYTELASSSVADYTKDLTMHKFLRSRFEARQVSFNTIYNPVRLLGFMGTVIHVDMPSVAGKITSINSLIDVNGNGTSQISMSTPRSIADKEIDPNNPLRWWDEAFFSDDFDWWPDKPFWIDPSYDYAYIGNTLKPLVFPTSKDSVTVNFHATDDIKDTGIRSRNNVNQLSSSINNLKRKYKIYDNPSTFTDREVKRELINEKEFWNFFIGKDDIDHTKDDDYDSISKMWYDAKKRKFYYNASKRFMKEKRDRVLLAKKEFE